MLPAAAMAQKPAAVYITCGQSNADGRALVADMPDCLRRGYRHLRYANVTASDCGGQFGDRVFGKSFAFCDIVNYMLDRKARQPFYSIKCTYGGTAIDTLAETPKRPVWCADPQWLARNRAYRGQVETQKSLALAFADGFNTLVDSTLSRLDGGYDVKAIMWHQGESDRRKAGHYYQNFRQLILFFRQTVYNKTRREKDLNLPFVFGTVCPRSRQYSAEIEKAQRQVAAELPNVYVVDMSDATLLPDQLHFDAKATGLLGRRMYKLVRRLHAVDK